MSLNKSLESAIRKLGKDIRYIFISLLIQYKRTMSRAIQVGYYTEPNLIKDVETYIVQLFPLNKEEFRLLWKDFKKIVEEKGKCNVLKEFCDLKEVIYNVHREALIKEIINRVNSLSEKSKKALYLFLTQLKEDIYQKQNYSAFNEIYYLVFNEQYQEEITKLLVKSGLLFQSEGISATGNDMGTNYEFPNYYEEVKNLILERVLKNVEFPDYSKSLRSFKNRFDIIANQNYIIEYIGIDVILKDNEESLEILDNIKMGGRNNLLDHPYVIKNGLINPLLKEYLINLINKTKLKFFENFNWLIKYILENLTGAFISKDTEHTKEISFEFEGRQYYIEFYSWYIEDVPNLNKSNMINLFLYHPNFKFLDEDLFEPEGINKIVAFGDDNRVFVKGSGDFINNFSSLFQEIKKNNYKLIYRESLPKGGDESPIKEKANLNKELELIQLSKTPLRFNYSDIKTFSGGDWKVEGIHSVFYYKIKIKNFSAFKITDIQIIFGDIPPGLDLRTDKLIEFAKLNPNQEVAPTYKLYATDNCVGCDLKGIVSFIDPFGETHTVKVKPFKICYVCNLLVPKLVSRVEFENRIKTMKSKKMEFDVKLRGSELENVIRKQIKECNFALLQEIKENQEENVIKIEGLAQGLYDKQDVAISVALKQVEEGSKLSIEAFSDKIDKTTDIVKDLSNSFEDIKDNFQKIKDIIYLLDEAKIRETLNIIIEKPQDLKGIIKKIINNSAWTIEEKDRWAKVVKETLMYYKEFERSKWLKFLKGFSKITLGKFASNLISEGIEHLIDWINSKVMG